MCQEKCASDTAPCGVYRNIFAKTEIKINNKIDKNLENRGFGLNLLSKGNVT